MILLNLILKSLDSNVKSITVSHRVMDKAHGFISKHPVLCSFWDNKFALNGTGYSSHAYIYYSNNNKLTEVIAVTDIDEM